MKRASLITAILATILIACVALYMFFGYMAPGSSPRLAAFYETAETYLDPEQPQSSADDFREVVSGALEIIRANHVDSPSEADLVDAALLGIQDLGPIPQGESAQQLIDASLRGMVLSLDNHSSFIPRELLTDTVAKVEGQFAGVGMRLVLDYGRVKVIAPIDKTPADRAGIETGDVITRIDGAFLDGWSLADVVGRLRGKPGTNVTVTLERGGQERFDLSLRREVITTPAMDYRAEGDAVYMRIGFFNKQTANQVRAALTTLQKPPDGMNRGIVLDLRRTPGGLASEAVAIADVFLSEGDIVSVQYRQGRDGEKFSAKPGDGGEEIPLVILIDGGTAGVPEVLARALQHHGRAVLMGTPSFGKADLQTYYPLPGNRALGITTARYIDHSGEALADEGLLPDVLIRDNENHSQNAWAGQNSLKESDCPPVGATEDRVLGCALKLLEYGSLKAFRERLGA